MARQSPGAYLIVNADDYGYFRCVSRGILKAVTHGIVTATGVLANAIQFAEDAARLRDCERVDVGVHLNLTEGIPLTTVMRSSLSRSGGRFPGKLSIASAILSGAVKTAHVRGEWRAQIERCLDSGLRVRFLNSHEHIHMLPALFSVTKALAKDYDIAHVRFPTSQLGARSAKSSLFRAVVIKALETINRRHADASTTHFLGMETSGKLNLPHLERILSHLTADGVYELMCHPGEFDAREVTDRRLRHYHDWDGELTTLTSPAARELLQRHGIRLVGYRHLDVQDNRLVVRPEMAELLASR